MMYIYNNQKLKSKRQSLRNTMSKPEQILWYYLKGRNLKDYKFRRQYSVGNYILDFYCPKIRLGIEIDGDSHFATPDGAIHDQEREKFLVKHNIRTIRFTNIDVVRNIDNVIEQISQYLPPLTPPMLGGETERLT